MVDQNKEFELFEQIRTAHRMVVAYYKRLFPIIQSTADKLDLKFYWWEPTSFDKPARGGTNILLGNRWEWDLVPALNTHYLFFSADVEDSNVQDVGDWLFDFHVITDTGALKDEVEANKDPLKLKVEAKDAKSVLRVSMHVATKKSKVNWYGTIWDDSGYPEFCTEPNSECLSEKYDIFGSGFEIPLSDLLEEGASEVLAKRIKTYQNQILKKKLPDLLKIELEKEVEK